MGWTSDEPQDTKKGMDKSSKILLSIIVCVVLIIISIIVMLLNIQINTVVLSVDGKDQIDYDINKLVSDMDGITYINIEEFAKLVGYEYHKGEYKSFSNEEDKCYVIGEQETATFYLNDNKINKLPVGSQFSDKYREHTVEKSIKMKNQKMYAPIEAISVAFNVEISKNDNEFKIYTLNYLVKVYNLNSMKLGYTDITVQTFENKKALLYDRLIVKKEDGLYKIVNCQNTKEIVPDKYTDIQFSESAQQFLVTNTLGQVGIINIDGTIEIEPIYNSISILEGEEKLYIVQKDTKYGIIKNKDEEVIGFKYDAIGSDITSVQINDITKVVNPVITIDACEGIVVKKNEKYGVIDIKGNIIVPIEVDSIYSLKNEEEEKLEYFMIYNGEELNIIEMLIEQGIIEDPDAVQENTNTVVIEENNTVTAGTQNSITNTALKNVV